MSRKLSRDSRVPMLTAEETNRFLSDIFSEILRYNRQTQDTAKKILIRYIEKNFFVVMLVRH